VLSKNGVLRRNFHTVMVAIALAGLIVSLIAPGWWTALGFAVLIVYLWFAPHETPTIAEQAEHTPFVQKRGREPESYRAIEWKGMIFRSQSEVKIAKTLDHRGIFFIPPTRVRLNADKDSRQSRELDFVICHEGKWGVLEVDGPYHVRELDAERDHLLSEHGISNIQRFPAERCYQQPQAVIDEFLHHLENMP